MATPEDEDEAGAEAEPGAWTPNPNRDPAFAVTPVPEEVVAFHRSLDGYAPTPLRELPDVAAELGVGRVFAKDESMRLGLPAFKALGASWAMRRALAARAVDAPAGATSSAAVSPVTFVTATDGNHGRAVARMARLLGHRAKIFVPDGVHPVAIGAIEAEGAPVTLAGGSYDHAVAMAAGWANDRQGAILLQDTAWDGYEEIPGWIVQGYATLFAELDVQLSEAGVDAPDVVFVPAGVGSLAQACVTHYRSRGNPARTRLVSVEPVVAACVLASLRTGEATAVTTSVTTMAGLNCGTVSSLAWPLLRAGLDGAVAVTDRAAAQAATALRTGGVDAGPCGWAPLAGARLVALDRNAPGMGAGAGGATWASARDHLGVNARSVIVLVATEGAAANPSGA